jgi:amino-acid N-acetyltransferase
VTDVRIRAATAEDFSVLVDWLAAASLPTADLDPGRMGEFLVADVAGNSAGLVGLELLGETGLLRSLVVDKTRRGHGIGEALVAAVLDRAEAANLDELWLLTIDADGYFARLGFEVRSRDEAPAAVRATPEFSSLCPGDAVLMSRYCVRSRSQSTS